MHHPPVISINPVQHTVHLDPVTDPLDYGDDTKTPSEDGEPTFELTRTVDLGIDASPIHLHTVSLRAEAIGFRRVAMASIA